MNMVTLNMYIEVLDDKILMLDVVKWYNDE